jgi:hypothetical protein
MMPSIATKFQYVNSPFFILTHYMFRLLRAILRGDIQLMFPRTILTSDLFPSGFPAKELYAFLLSHTHTHTHICATWPAHLILIYLIILIIIGEEYKSRRSSLLNFLHSLFTSSLFGLPQHPVSNILSPCFSLKFRDQITHPHRTTGKIIVLYILIFTFFDSRRED